MSSLDRRRCKVQPCSRARNAYADLNAKRSAVPITVQFGGLILTNTTASSIVGLV